MRDLESKISKLDWIPKPLTFIYFHFQLGLINAIFLWKINHHDLVAYEFYFDQDIQQLTQSSTKGNYTADIISKHMEHYRDNLLVFILKTSMEKIHLELKEYSHKERNQKIVAYLNSLNECEITAILKKKFKGYRNYFHFAVLFNYVNIAKVFLKHDNDLVGNSF